MSCIIDLIIKIVAELILMVKIIGMNIALYSLIKVILISEESSVSASDDENDYKVADNYDDDFDDHYDDNDDVENNIND